MAADHWSRLTDYLSPWLPILLETEQRGTVCKVPKVQLFQQAS